ncbi:MAG: hypothetical protein CVV64_00995 [Candidatus Wallbacteria bacterium HGW-Wallbacteria-1]|uniref:Uncharacterized protein n=1 Tax=Candidatus Wallbacteria bacterium HGW-Wallbacteria-1 TaxID=2013854 RepID=A0A2N1PUJ0_9BACT|nr:MAG: hypothetical protein CVV64_00995 [Candidatus Wallbacteria bacterium HGW-Wallbacteria-1]
MSVTPIEIQTNFVQQTNVDKMRQAQLNVSESGQTHASAISDEITEENKAVIETNPGEPDGGIRDSEERKGSGRGPRRNPRKGPDDDEDDNAPKEMKDPRKGKFVDITL